MRSSQQPSPLSVRKIAVLRANGIGDYVFALPALEALRARFPHAEIVQLGKPWHKEFLTGRPGPVDRVVIIPRCAGVGEPEDFVNDDALLDRFFHSMAEERFDLAVQLHGGGRYSNPFVSRLGATLTVGLRAAEAAPLHRWLRYVYFQPESLRYLETVALVGASPVALEPRLAAREADVEEAFRAVPEDGRPTVVLHPGATAMRRRWPPELFAQVGEQLARVGYRILITGDQSEAALAQSVCREMGQTAEVVCHLSLGGVLELLRRAALVISNDSGPLHLAAAAGTRTVGIYWCGNMITAGIVWRTRHRPVLSWRLDCPVCGRNTIQDNCSHQASFVEDVQVEDVMREARDLLQDLRDECRPDHDPHSP